MRLIDADKLKPDAEYNAWDGEFTAYSAKQIEEAPTVEVKASGDYIKREDALTYIIFKVVGRDITYEELKGE